MDVLRNVLLTLSNLNWAFTVPLNKGIQGIRVKLSNWVGWHGQTMSLYVLNRDRLSMPFLRHTTAQNPLETWLTTVPRWRGCRGWKRNRKTMREKPKADETNNYAYNKWLQPFANNLRKKMTKAEAYLWKEVLKNMSGVIQRIEKVVGRRDRVVQSTPCTPASGGHD